MSRLSEKISVANDVETEDVPIAAWDCTIRLRSMDLLHRGGYLERMINAREEQDDLALAQLQAELVVACAVDPEDGSDVFTPEDIPMLLGKHGGIVGLLATKASRLSGLDADAESRIGRSFLDSVEATPSAISTSS